MHGRFNFSGFKRIDVEGGAIYTWSEMSGDYWNPDGSKRQSLKYVSDFGSLRVNVDVPDDVFTVPMSQVRIKMDTDTGETVHLD